jgi:transcriptional regulator
MDLLKGTLDVLVLRSLAGGARHGYAVARWIRASSEDVLVVEDRALYLSLHRLEARGEVESEWGTSENGRRARYYRLTRSGRKQLKSEEKLWTEYAGAVFRVLRADPRKEVS